MTQADADLKASTLSLDRMAIEEAGPDPARIAAAIHRQRDFGGGAVPISAIAMALDIIEIRESAGASFEGALVMPPDRNVGAIAVNAAARPRRKRFTIAHELGHFLSLHHQPIEPGRFACSARDLGSGWMPGRFVDDRHRRQEAEANRFAIELLAPARLMRSGLVGVPDLAKVVALSERLDLSREATVRRYAELHRDPMAIIFSKDGRLRYIDRRDAFPAIRIERDAPLPVLPKASDGAGLSDHEDADPRDWLGAKADASIVIQTLHQDDGFAITLLTIDRDGTEPEEA